MRSNSSQSVVSVLLTAVLVVNGIGLHGFGHAHVGGEDDHSHVGEATAKHKVPISHYSHDSHDDHHHAQHDENHQCSVCDSQLSAGLVNHSHFSLFGFEFSIPTSDDSQGDEQSQSWEYLCQREDVVVPIVRSLQSDLLQQTLLATDVCQTVATLREFSATAQVPSLPLCDGARFERSGVLLV